MEFEKGFVLCNIVKSAPVTEYSFYEHRIKSKIGGNNFSMKASIKLD